jgi:hypothetical protein
MASIQYTRDQLTALYHPNLPLPEGTIHIHSIVNSDHQTPELCKVQQIREYHPDPKSGPRSKIRADIVPQKAVGPTVTRFASTGSIEEPPSQPPRPPPQPPKRLPAAQSSLPAAQSSLPAAQSSRPSAPRPCLVLPGFPSGYSRSLFK